MCLELLDRHSDKLPHRWVTGDDELGRPAGFRRDLRDRHKCYLLAAPSNTTIRDLEISPPEYSGAGRPPQRPSRRVDRWVAERTTEDWTTIEVRDGEKGPLTVEATKRRVETGRRGGVTVAKEILVVVRYRDRDSKVVKTDYYLSNAETETSLAEFCRAAKAEHRVEECFKRGKGQAGLADDEVRNWPGWRHHQTLSLLASWFLNVETRRAEKKTPAITFNQVRLGIASILRVEQQCDTPYVVVWRTEQRLLRNQRARFYHWKTHNRIPPKNLERKRI